MGTGKRKTDIPERHTLAKYSKLSDKRLLWLLAGDPAIRGQVLRDLAGAAARTVEGERRQVARAGWGARLLALQDPQGTWAGGLYSPKWVSTAWIIPVWFAHNRRTSLWHYSMVFSVRS